MKTKDVMNSWELMILPAVDFIFWFSFLDDYVGMATGILLTY